VAGLGFLHGVLNTDNMSSSPDDRLRPYGFIDAFDVDNICNHSDEHGRYSYRMQPRWALDLYALDRRWCLDGRPRCDQGAIDVYLEEYARRSTRCSRQARTRQCTT